MADFVPTIVNRTAVRDLELPFADVEEFNTIVEAFIDANPAGCVGYTTKKGEVVPAIFRNRERYTAKVEIYNPDLGKTFGIVSVQAPTIAAYEAAAAEIYENEALETAIGGDSYRAFDKESYYCQLKCHDPGGDDFYVTFTRKAVRLSSYQDEDIRDAIEDWADGIEELD